MSYSIREGMDVEDEYLDLLKPKECSHAEALEATRNELEEARAREKEERRQKEEAFAELADLKRRLGKMKSFFVRLFALALYSFAGKSEHISDPGPRTPDLHPEPE
ncbi:hypothetical protein [Desulfonatronospira sp.]|uniref:hypothetical protein n=1 Tax=Desulfonatronospira sp. TaxID=1962951 RepID=UPI0025B995BE|nr:hypothetical protein [Desulfonatronospira sp.]